MSIRCEELNLPAVIGIVRKIIEKLKIVQIQYLI